MARRNEMAFRDVDDELGSITGRLSEMAFKEKPRETSDGTKAVGRNVVRQGPIRADISTERMAAVVYIDVGTGTGTGFYIKYGDKHCIMTNNHVIADPAEAGRATCYFDFEDGRRGQKPIQLKPDGLFITKRDPFDFTIVQVADARQVAQRPPIPFVPRQMKVGDKVIIVQHPGGSRKTLTEGKIESYLAKRDKGDMTYSADTLPGSSGSPVFDKDFNLVGIHHHGDGAARVNGGTSIISIVSMSRR